MMDLDPRLYENVSVSDNDVRNIVLSYLMHNCFKETAETFLSSTGLELPVDYTVDVDKRKAIFSFVLEGNALKAIDLTEELAPNLLENDMDLHFDLLSLHFIELVRSRKCTEALEFGQKKLTPFGKVPKYVEKLEDFMALLAYEEPEKSPMFHLLSPEYRQNVADSLNRAVLAHANRPAYSSLERVIQQATVVRQYLQQEVGKSFKGFNGKNPILVGPWGGLGGTLWDDGVHSTVRQIVITHGAAIDSIKIEYDLKGKSVWSEKHGGDGGTKTDQVKLDYPQEILTSVSGYYGSLGGCIVVRSLTFGSNLSKYGPFGSEEGTPFSLPVAVTGKVIGFHGKSGWFLDSIGCHIKKEKNATPSSNAPSALRSITRPHDKNGNRYADSNAGYDMVLAVRDRGDSYSVLTSNNPKEQYPNQSQDATLWNKMVSLPSFYSDNGTMTISTPVRFGPWGGNGGTIFDDGIYTGVRQINLTRGLGISSMKVLYDRNGQAIWGDKRGSSGAARAEKVVFDFPSEILTHITGYFSSTMIMGSTVIKSLTFHTTKKSHGPFGDETGTFFSSCLTEGRIVGFHGRDGWYIDSIGVHVLEGKVLSQRADRALTETSPSRHADMLAVAQREIGDEVTYGVVKEPIPVGPGPWGGEGGKPWDDGVYTGVKQIYIMRADFIGSVQIEYDRSGQSIWSTRHGNGGQITHRIKLDYPHEVLNCIYGYYNTCQDEGPRVLRSITLVSNRGKYGPFGEEVGTYFSSATTEGKVVGFHGRSGLYLDAIGVHMQHWLGDRNRTAAPSSNKYYISKYLF
uniref:Jacalin-type lectin domain-containing protein n=1 Tax=Oryza glumipatula TaxID=40148 RepID=A0A0D9YFP9_9ORYZ